jgi:4-amino-4-deoxy-L-arabinose transferase-like glycosyltransferase
MDKKIISFKYPLVIIWFAAVLFFYFSAYPLRELLARPPAPHSLILSWAPLKHLLFLGLLLLCAAGYGGIFLIKARGTLGRIETMLFSAGTGFLFLSLSILGLDSLGFISYPLYSAILAAGIALFFILNHKFLLGPVRITSHLPLAAIAAVPLIFTLLGALAPPTNFDSLVYHLALPQKYISLGKIAFVPNNIFFSFPQNIEMLFQFSLKLDKDILANLLCWSFFGLCGIAVFSLARRFLTSRAGLASAAVWFFTPVVMLIGTAAYVDLGLAFFCLLGFYSFLLWRDSKAPYWLGLSGIFAGAALGAKYTAAAAIGAVIVLIIVEGKPAKAAGALLWFLLPALVVFSPWLIKNAVLVKNPFAPWAASAFRNSLIPAAVAKGYLTDVSHHGIKITGAVSLLRLPWELTVSGFKYGGGFDILGPLFLILIPVLFLIRKIDKITKVLLIYSICFGCVWLLTAKVLRFLVPALPVLSLLAGAGLSALLENKKLRSVFLVFVLAALVHNALLFHWIMAFIDPYGPALGGESRQAYLASKLNYFNCIENGVNKLPLSSRTLFLGETRSYYCVRDCLVPTVFDINPAAAWANNAPDQKAMLENFRSAGITHLMVNNFEFSRLSMKDLFTSSGERNWEALKKDHLRPVYSDRYCDLYEIIY